MSEVTMLLSDYFIWIPILSLLAAVFWIMIPVLCSLEPVQKFLHWITRSCYHDWEAYACRVKWTHCGICANILEEPFSYHPTVLLRCRKCGEEDSELDHEQVRSLSGVMDNTELLDMEVSS